MTGSDEAYEIGNDYKRGGVDDTVLTSCKRKGMFMRHERRQEECKCERGKSLL